MRDQEGNVGQMRAGDETQQGQSGENDHKGKLRAGYETLTERE